MNKEQKLRDILAAIAGLSGTSLAGHLDHEQALKMIFSVAIYTMKVDYGMSGDEAVKMAIQAIEEFTEELVRQALEAQEG